MTEPQAPPKATKNAFVDLGLATTIMLGLASIVVIAGAIVCIVGNLSFHDYLRELTILAAAFGLLGIGRAIAPNGEKKP